jgi:hypothetical protein
MRQARLARTRAGTAAADRRGRRRVMRSPKRRRNHERPAGRQQPGDRMDPQVAARWLPRYLGATRVGVVPPRTVIVLGSPAPARIGVSTG